MAEKATLGKKKSKLFVILGGLLLFFLIGLFFLPNLISSDWAENKIKEAAGDRLAGKLDFDDLSLSWLNGIQCRGISYDSPAEGVLVKVVDVKISKGLLALAADRTDAGIVTIENPVVSVFLKEKKGSPGTAAEKPAPETGVQTAASGGRSGAFVLPPIGGKLSIKDGTVIAVSSDLTEKSVVKELNVQLHVVAIEHLLDYLITFQSGDGLGRVEGKGKISLPMGDMLQLDQIQSQGTLNIKNWEIADLLSILAGITDSPTGSGQLNGHLNVSGSMASAMQIKGTLDGKKIRLQGGPFKSDTPSMENVKIEVDGEKTGSAFTLNRLVLTSPFASGTVSGTFDDNSNRELDGQAVIDLAQLFAQLPATLNLKKGTRVSKGKVDLKAKVIGTDKSTSFDATVRLAKLEGVAGKKKISWDKPVNMEVRGERGTDGLRLDKLVVQSTFLNGTGQGDINNMKVKLKADIGLALKEIGKFIQLDGWQSGGKIDLDLQMVGKTERVRSVRGAAGITNFTLRYNDRVIAPRDTFKTDLTADVRLSPEMRPREIVSGDLSFKSWAGSGNAAIKNLLLPSGEAAVSLKDLGFKGSFDLGRLTALLQTLEVLPVDSRIGGMVNLATRVTLKGHKLNLGDTRVDIGNFVFQNGSQKFSDREMVFTTRGSADLKNKSATLKPFEFKTSSGRLAFPELVISDWSRLENGVKTEGSIDLDLGPLTTLLGDVVKLPAGTEVTGKAVVKLNVDLTDTKQQSVKLAGNIGPVKITSKEKVLFAEDSIKLGADLIGDLYGQNFSFSKVEFSSPPLTLNGAGRLIPDKKEHLLTSQGDMTLNLKALGDYIKAFSDIKLEMAGTAKRPFTVKVRSADGQWKELPKHTQLSTSFHADRVQATGVDITSLDVAVQLADSLAAIDIQGKVNRGEMVLKPKIDFSADPPLLLLPENSRVLTGVGLAEDETGDVLAKIHPLFKGSAISAGTVDLGVQHFSWPLDKAARKDGEFTCSLTFNDVRLQVGGLLSKILDLMKANEREVTLSDQPMECVAKDDRVRCSPLALQIKDYSIIMTGSVGLDQSLDYEVQIPVTRNMVGSDGYKYLKGTHLTVPIKGTVAKPSLSDDFVEDAIGDLLMQAGKKQISEQAGKLLQNLFK